MTDATANKDSVVGVRMTPEFRAGIKAAAVRHFGGNESLLLREAGRAYCLLRKKLGPQFEPTLALLLGEAYGETVEDATPPIGDARSGADPDPIAA